MKTGKVSRILAIALSTAALAVYGCGGGGGGGGGAGGGGGTTISNATQAGDASASATQSASVSSNVGQTLSNLASPAGMAPKYRSPLAGKDAKFNKLHAAEVKAMKAPTRHFASAMRKAKAARATNRATTTLSPTTNDCLDSGTYTESISVNDNETPTNSADDTYTITEAYSNCREYDEQMNGTVTTTGSFSATSFSFSMTLGNGSGIVGDTVSGIGDFKVELFGDNYTNLFAKYEADLTMSGSMNTEGNSFTYTANGKEEYSDFIDTFNMTFTNLQFTSSYTLDPTTEAFTGGTDTANGGFKEAWTDNSVDYEASITFTNFATTWTETSTYATWSVDGTVAINFTPDSYCDIEGTFVIDTTIPVKEDFTLGYTTEGRVVINTTTIILFNFDGTVTVTAPDGTTTNYSSPGELEATCQLEDFEEDTTSQTTFDNTTSVTTTGSSLLATMSWNDADGISDSDMDLHLAHYNTTTPTSSSTTDWEIYYAAPTSGGYGELDYDDTDGYGPEHITMQSLPTGYYVLYVDRYSLNSDTSATTTVTLDIGGNLYTFPSYTFTLAITASHRVADLKVDSAGTVTLLPPDTSLTLLYPASGARPVKAKR